MRYREGVKTKERQSVCAREREKEREIEIEREIERGGKREIVGERDK